MTKEAQGSLGNGWPPKKGYKITELLKQIRESV